jgi:CRP-like cAMP-binding protein
MEVDVHAAAELLLQEHPQVSPDHGALIAILERCELRQIPPGEVLCREGGVGQQLFFVLAGRFTVSKSDVRGVERPIGKVEAPALLGQLATIERTRRTATVIAVEPALVALMDLVTFQLLVRDTGPEGATLRGLLLSSLTRQLVAGNARLRQILAAQRPEAGSVESTGQAMLSTSGLFEGWSDELGRRSPPKE